MRTVQNSFNDKGNLKYDPYRRTDKQIEIDAVFDIEGNVKEGVLEEIDSLIKKNNWGYKCDAVAIYHSEVFAGRTKGNYTPVYYWR